MSLKITTTLSLSSQSVANNTSTVTWKVKYSKSSGTYNNNGVKYYVNVDGNRVKSGTWKPKKGTTSGTIASGTTTIKHNADGTHAQIRAYAKVYDTGFSPSSADDYSPYLSLPTIKRTFTVSYNANGGTGAPASQTKTYGVNLTLSSTIPTRAGYAFKGWATSSTGAVAYPAGGTYSANSAVTLYAVWELLGNVKMGSYSAIRCDESGNADDEGTWGKFTCTYILSGQGANEGSVTGRYRASDVSTWTNIANISQSDPHIKAEGVSSLSVNASCLISNLSQDKSYLIELTVTDSYGNTAIASDYISQAYFTMDFLAGGKGIGIGTTASCDESKHPNGLLTCGMDADFKGDVNINGILIKDCHKIRLSKTGDEGTYTYDSIDWYMLASQIVYLEEKISEQLNGIIIVWSFYNGSAQNWGWNFTVIPKAWIPDNPNNGGMTTFMVENATVGNVGAKYIYIRDNRIVGNDNNSKTGTGTSAIKYANNKFVLRYVYGF